jgi:TonB family protein
MIRRSLILLALFAGAAAMYADDTPLAARVTVYRRPLPYVNGIPATPALPTMKLAEPASGWGSTIEEIRGALSSRKSSGGAGVIEVYTAPVVSVDGTQIFSPASGGAINLQRTGANVALTLPQSPKVITLAAKPSTVIFAGKDEMLYVVITLMPPAQLDAPTVVVAGMRPPDLLQRVDPPTPPGAKEERVGGMVMLQARIENDGKVSAAAVLSTPRPDLGAAAVEALKQWKFAPMKVNGQPTIAYLNVTMNFAVE